MIRLQSDMKEGFAQENHTVQSEHWNLSGVERCTAHSVKGHTGPAHLICAVAIHAALQASCGPPSAAATPTAVHAASWPHTPPAISGFHPASATEPCTLPAPCIPGPAVLRTICTASGPCITRGRPAEKLSCNAQPCKTDDS